LAEAVPVAQVPLPCKRPVVHDKHVVRAPLGHEAHGAVHPVVKTLAVHVVPAVFKVYPALQAVHVTAVLFAVHAAQLATPVTPVAPAAQVIQTVPLRTEPNGHSVHVAGVAGSHLLQAEAVVHDTEH